MKLPKLSQLFIKSIYYKGVYRIEVYIADAEARQQMLLNKIVKTSRRHVNWGINSSFFRSQSHDEIYNENISTKWVESY